MEHKWKHINGNMKLGHLTRSPLITSKNQDKKGVIPEKNI